ncbi:MAG: hypothetical protein IJ719_02465 [Clostridia bacterium]|nr:hypothetical protein [Clostridia bacterium]
MSSRKRPQKQEKPKAEGKEVSLRDIYREIHPGFKSPYVDKDGVRRD